MAVKHLYEYAVIRVVPRVEREEFINVGVILCASKSGYLHCKVHLDEERLKVLDPKADTAQICANLDALLKVCGGDKDGGNIASLDIASRFRWLTAVRSSVIQTSRPHPGLTDNLDETLERLFNEYVD
ncbi:MAG: DUF3037 domain-containing protein [Chitinophagales bacterium]|nr:DUF3037 domain-containing protein [Chitinophagales bacterium]